MSLADSAGVPWEGRSFHANPLAGDDGAAPPALLAALEGFVAGEVEAPAVLDALRDARLLVPLVAHRGDEGTGAHGRLVDKTQELSIVTVEGPDGRRVLPAFTSVRAMSAWNPQARPIPIEARRVALAAASEQTDLVVLDPVSPTEHVVRRPALKALATGEPWTPSWTDAAVRDAVVAGAVVPDVLAVRIAPGDPHARLRGPEVEVELELDAALPPERVEAIVAHVSASWSADATIAERVDSIAVRLARVERRRRFWRRRAS